MTVKVEKKTKITARMNHGRKQDHIWNNGFTRYKVEGKLFSKCQICGTEWSGADPSRCKTHRLVGFIYMK